MPETRVKYRSTIYTEEEFKGVLASFTPDQLLLFESLICDCVEDKSAIEYNAESPLAAVRLSGYYAGKIELLNLLISHNTQRS